MSQQSDPAAITTLFETPWNTHDMRDRRSRHRFNVASDA